MAIESIEEGFQVFVHDGEVAFGAVRQVLPGAKPRIVVYIENAGDFVVPLSAVKDVHDEKVILDGAEIGADLKDAITRAHTAEDPWIADRTDE